MRTWRGFSLCIMFFSVTFCCVRIMYLVLYYNSVSHCEFIFTTGNNHPAQNQRAVVTLHTTVSENIPYTTAGSLLPGVNLDMSHLSLVLHDICGYIRLKCVFLCWASAAVQPMIRLGL